ncbi:unnamed protein product [Polarella glacialis]|uniref:Tetratricopeptide repeat protein 29 n=1 Tax=Polarella glacialis TaxID=89957 RepID=A0A813KR53_POLGL|nr:unnamed protein product [Polarella glacialis]
MGGMEAENEHSSAAGVLARYKDLGDSQDECVKEALLEVRGLLDGTLIKGMHPARARFTWPMMMQMKPLFTKAWFLPEYRRDAALEAAQEAQSSAAQFSDRRLEAQAQLTVAQVYLKRGELDRAAQAAQEAQSLCQREDDRRQEVRALLVLSSVLMAKDNVQEALDAAGEARLVAEQSEDKEGEANALRSLSDIYQERGDLDQALELARKERLCREKTKQKRGAALALLNIVNLHTCRGETKAAARAAEAARTLCRKEGSRLADLLVESLTLAAQAHMLVASQLDEDAEQPEGPAKDRRMSEAATRALKAAEEAVEVAGPLDNNLANGTANLCHAEVLTMVGETRQAITSARRASECLNRVGHQQEAGCALMICARGYQEMKTPGLAEKAAEQALDLFKSSGDSEGEKAALQLLDEIGPRMVGGLTAGSYADVPAGGAPALTQSVAEAAPQGPDAAQVREMIRREVELVVGSADDVQDDIPLMDTGLDSLSSVQFRNDLTRDFNVKLPASLVFDYPTIGALTEKILESIRDQA